MLYAPTAAWRLIDASAILLACIGFLVASIGWWRATRALRSAQANVPSPLALLPGAEEGFAASEAFSRSLIDALADGIFVAQDHRFVFANAALPRMLGYEHDEFVGLPFEAVVGPEYALDF